MTKITLDTDNLAFNVALALENAKMHLEMANAGVEGERLKGYYMVVTVLATCQLVLASLPDTGGHDRARWEQYRSEGEVIRRSYETSFHFTFHKRDKVVVTLPKIVSHSNGVEHHQVVRHSGTTFKRRTPFTTEEVSEIKKLLRSGDASVVEIAQAYGCSVGAIYSIKSGQSHKDVI